MQLAQERFAEVREDLKHMVARDSHELMRAMEVHSIIDCADMAAAASLFRTESRWGLYHNRTDYPERDNENWFCFSQLFKNQEGAMDLKKRDVDPYVVPIDDEEKDIYDKQRVEAQA